MDGLKGVREVAVVFSKHLVISWRARGVSDTRREGQVEKATRDSIKGREGFVTPRHRLMKGWQFSHEVMFIVLRITRRFLANTMIGEVRIVVFGRHECRLKQEGSGQWSRSDGWEA